MFRLRRSRDSPATSSSLRKEVVCPAIHVVQIQRDQNQYFALGLIVEFGNLRQRGNTGRAPRGPEFNQCRRTPRSESELNVESSLPVTSNDGNFSPTMGPPLPKKSIRPIIGLLNLLGLSADRQAQNSVLALCAVPAATGDCGPVLDCCAGVISKAPASRSNSAIRHSLANVGFMIYKDAVPIAGALKSPSFLVPSFPCSLVSSFPVSIKSPHTMNTHTPDQPTPTRCRCSLPNQRP